MPSSTTSCEPRVLLVDDNEAMLARAASALTPGCLVVGAAKEGQSALEAARNLHPDVIVLDISMPGMSGLEIASCLREAGSTAALVFLTVHDEEEIVSAAKAAGGIGYVVKSRLVSDLAVAVREAVAGRPFVSPIH
jgi:two-component system response regulator NreC